MKKMPSMLQAADYSAASNYLKAVKAVGTDDSDKVMAYLKANKINDMFAKNGVIRPDGRMVHDMYLMEVKKPPNRSIRGTTTSGGHHPGRPGLRHQGGNQVQPVEIS
jgi:ABC-type branched-subunit amino acid transport system substrate-binding protein